MSDCKKLTAEQTYNSFPVEALDFELTDSVESLEIPLGQERAREAIEFGVDIEQEGFNLFVMGPPGVGKHDLVRKVLNEHSQTSSPPFDWCYVNNFDNPQNPDLLKLPQGLGHKLRQDMEQFVEDLLTAIPSTFQSEDYHNRRQELENSSREQYEKAFRQLDNDAREKGIALMRTPSGYTLAPLKEDEVISPEDFEKLPDQEKSEIEKNVEEIQQRLQEVLRSMPKLTRKYSEALKTLNREFTESTIEQFVALLESSYRDHPAILDYLEKVKQNAIENAQEFLNDDKGTDIQQIKQRVAEYHSYAVNVLIDNSGTTGAPLIFEDNPTYQNLVGRIEYISQMGTLLTDFTLIKCGALHQANGGYLVMEAQKLLSNVYAWEGLKRALISHRIKIASLQQALSLESTQSLEPESVPLSVKVILTGPPLIYYLLNQYDPEFGKLFKVGADFSSQMDRDTETGQLYARMIATQQQTGNLLPLNKEAVARVIEQASRNTGDSQKLSLNIESTDDLLKEADYWAKKENSDHISQQHIETTLEKIQQRKNRIQLQLQENILRDINLIDTQGEQIGQVNGLTVLQLSNYMFGTAARITATARLGHGRVLDIEREVKMGGDIHSKGVLILSSYLANRYAKERPLPLAASLVFEQSYGGVDGDSATAAELCVLLSAIAQLPLNQSLAVTGSMNQHGQIQAIGGVNEKIEGFFDICNKRGLTGNQGVIIPESNQVHLMLRRDVREAVIAGTFSIFTAKYVDDVMSLLCGLPAGTPDKDGNYDKGSFNEKVMTRIGELQKMHRRFATDKEESNNNGDNHD
jgi:lon-related putative ATP-dependent protease